MVGYSEKAQPFLDAIALGFFGSGEIRDWLIEGTPAASRYAGAIPLYDEQRAVRWRSKPTKQPFWANYWCGKDRACKCRIDVSGALESDAIFFLRNKQDRILAMHVEFKHPKEPFKFGQPEAYPLRAECFSKTHQLRTTLNAHNDWATVLFCGEDTLIDPRIAFFQRVISHSKAKAKLKDWPA